MSHPVFMQTAIIVILQTAEVACGRLIFAGGGSQVCHLTSAVPNPQRT